MLQVTKSEPDFFSNKKKKVTNPKQSDAWKEISDIRAGLREYILTNEQESMCVYCEKVITSDVKKSNIDHFKTRDQFPQATLDYENLFVSCNNKGHCSDKKDNYGLTKEEYKKIINPSSNEVDNSFYYFAGDMVGENEKAKFTIDVFELNHISLVQERKKIIQNFQYCKEFDTTTLTDMLGGHKNLIYYLKSEEL